MVYYKLSVKVYLFIFGQEDKELYMNRKIKFKGKLKSYMKWPIYMAVIMVCLDIPACMYDSKSGGMLVAFTLVYSLLTALFYVRSKQVVVREMVNFGTRYSSVQKKLLNEFEIPYALLDYSGKLLWFNEAFAMLNGIQSGYKKSITTLFPTITREFLEKADDTEDKTIEFGDRLNIISGETGSGKSILLDSLGLCFGERADKTLIRTGESKMRATALFTNISSKAREYVTDTLGIECDDQIILDRECDQNGKSVARINGELTTVAGLKAVSNFLVDLHGQHEHQAIISPDYQLNIIDEYAGQTAKDLLAKINSHIDAVMDAKSQIDALGGDDAQREYFINLYRYQIDEIAGANIQPNELEDLVARRNKMNSVEKIIPDVTKVLNGIHMHISVRKKLFLPMIIMSSVFTRLSVYVLKKMFAASIMLK